MFEVLLAVHLVICIALVGAILLQRSEGGGALGIGGGGPGNMMSGRSASNLIVRTTQVLGALFFATSLGLTLIASHGREEAPSSIMAPEGTGDGLTGPLTLSPGPAAPGTAAPGTAAPGAPAAPAATGDGSIPLSVPTTTAPAAPAAPAAETTPAPEPAQ